MVSSVIAQIAPYATIVDAPILMGEKDISQYQLAYDAFKAAGTPIINQSFSSEPDAPNGTSGSHGVIEEQYARLWNMLITQSAGNNRWYGNDERHIGQEPACPNNMNALCVGAHDQYGAKVCYSDWVNPGTRFADIAPDREEPDLLAFGGSGTPLGLEAICTNVVPQGVRVASRKSTTDWENRFGGSPVTGTSFSAPTTAATAALVRQVCGKSWGAPPSGLMLRALLMASAQKNGNDFNYSTLKPGDDWVDGAGDLTLGPVLAFCKGELASGVYANAFESPGILADGQPPPEPNIDEPAFPHDPPQAQTASLYPTNQSSVFGGDGVNDKRLTQKFTVAHIATGGRVRAVLSWDACYDLEVAPGKIGTDYDLILYNEKLGRVYYASQSNDDNNEGFDVDIRDGFAGDYSLYVTWPSNASGCDTSPGVEPFALAWWWWTNE